MTERTYPYQGWVLTPAFKPKKVTLTARYGYASQDYGDLTDSSKLYALSEIFPSKEAAIAGGWARVHAQQSKLDKAQANINKRSASLKKAETT